MEPDLIDGIKFASVSREPLDNDPAMPGDVLADWMCAMDRDSVPEESNRSAVPLIYMRNELSHRVSVEVCVVLQEMKTKVESPAQWAYG
jgi:hypothetical protein